MRMRLLTIIVGIHKAENLSAFVKRRLNALIEIASAGAWSHTEVVAVQFKHILDDT